jgi:hypothetical protein
VSRKGGLPLRLTAPCHEDGQHADGNNNKSAYRSPENPLYHAEGGDKDDDTYYDGDDAQNLGA